MSTLLPPNATELERALSDVLASATSQNIPIRSLWNPDTCPEKLLPYLAWTFSVDNWSPLWQASRKRAEIRKSVYLHRHKGTPGAITRALADIGYRTRMVQWFDEDAVPYTFRIEIETTDQPVTPALLEEIQRATTAAKNQRSFMRRLTTVGQSSGRVTVAAASIAGINAETLPWSLQQLLAAASQLADIVENSMPEALNVLPIRLLSDAADQFADIIENQLGAAIGVTP